jgi:hypothetical protein
MFVARLICSDTVCAETFEARAATLTELTTFACDCGCGLELLGWADVVEDEDRVLELVAVG